MINLGLPQRRGGINQNRISTPESDLYQVAHWHGRGGNRRVDNVGPYTDKGFSF